MANEYLQRTPTSTGNRKVWTWSGWVKLNSLSTSYTPIMEAFTGGSDVYCTIAIENNVIKVNQDNGAGGVMLITASPSHRDPSSWFHLLVSVDTTQTLAQNRVRIYVNGDEEVVTYSTTPSINFETHFNRTGGHRIGARWNLSATYINAEYTDVFLVDGQALTPDVFGFYKQGNGYISAGSDQATDFRPGQWVPKTPRVIKAQIERNGGFGVNGFYLPMNDSSNFGADFHTTPNSIITLKGEDLPQPRNGAPTTTDAYVSQLRTDPYAANLVLAVPGILLENTNTELVTNGDFSNGTTSWTVYDDGILSATGGILKVTSTNGSNLGVANQQVTTVIGTRYTFSVDVIPGNVTGRLRVDNSDYWQGDYLNQSNSDYGTHTVTFEATSTTTYISLSPNSPTNGDHCFFTNVSLKEETPVRDYSADIKGSGSNKTLTANGNASVAVTPSYYGSALSFDGSGDYLTTPNTGDFDFGSGDFTIEYWALDNTVTGERRTLYLYNTTQEFLVGHSGQTVFFAAYDSGGNLFGQPTTGNVLTIGQWNHIAVEKYKTNLTIYVNGVAGAISTTYTGTIRSGQTPLYIGYDPVAAGRYFNGYIQDLRIYKGVAKYKGGFDVPKPYTPVGIETWRAVPDTTANNFATLNPLGGTGTLSDGNLKFVAGGIQARDTTFATTGNGKWYVEFRTGNVQNGTWEVIGIHPINKVFGPDRAYAANGQYWNGSAWVSFGTAWSNGDIIGLAYNQVAGEISFYLNGTLQGTTQSYTSSEQHYFVVRGNSGTQIICNFGQNPTFSGNTTAGTFTDSNGKGLFKYEPPSGFLALCEDNLPTPAIKNPGEYFKTVLWTGDGTSGRSIVGVGFTPDLVWVKGRNNASWGHFLQDSVRGVQYFLKSNETGAEGFTTPIIVSSLNYDGFTINANGNSNNSGDTYVAWCWRAGAGTTSTNTDGSIQSVVSVNQDAGFSIVSYTGTGSAATVGHGLGKAPKFIIVKGRDTADAWATYHATIGKDGGLQLESTAAAYTSSNYWGTVTPGSLTFGVGSGTPANNRSGDRLIAYCWAEIEGFSKFGSYVGNGSADGPFVYCGFKPAVVIIKNSGAVYDWWIKDNARDSTNGGASSTLWLRPNLSNIETIYTDIDFLSNGFKFKDSHGGLNGGNNNYIFAAFAESPFQTANAK
jgi:hypothetical protein